ncbi:metalloprotease secretion protein [Duganella rhizosphaerae]|uniref:HlyD family type I secretion periplasmic adaptor subunit n=1 Tax=Duganella rhizosphaerae TaxID=2885763 RepID=UPI0030E846C3
MNMKLIDTKALASDVISHDVAPLTVNTDASGYSRLGWIIVLVGVLGTLGWACFAPLDKGVPLSGTVTNEGNRKAIQYQIGGTVDEILVKEGDIVKKGQVLVKMNSVVVESQADISKTQLIANLSAAARLRAERDGKSSLVFPAQLEENKGDPRVIENIALQTQLLNSRQAALHSELAAAQESIAGLKSQLSGVQSGRDSKIAQARIVKEQYDNLKDLEREGYVARSKVQDYERTYVQLNGSIAEDLGTIGHIQRQMAELTLKLAQRNQEYQRDVRIQLADVEKEVLALSSRQVAEKYAVNNAEVRSPVDGVVIGMAVFTRGAVVQPGFRMMDIVPVEDTLIVEGRLAVNLVDKVHAGLPVELMFSAFNSNTTPHVPGVLTKVSPDRLTDEHNGAPYYSVQVRVTPEGMKMMQKKKLLVRAGMPVELFVKTGERTMMSYLLKPVFDRAKTSMTEE